MRSTPIKLTNFALNMHKKVQCIRADNEEVLYNYVASNPGLKLLAKGRGLSYNDSFFNSAGLVLDTTCLNHLLEFDKEKGLIICQGGVLIKDLFLLHPQFLPAVVPGTLNVTVAGCIAHDVHGKNNTHCGSFGRHVVWVDLLVQDKVIRCSREHSADLFYATIGGLGLTGIIMRVALHLKKATQNVQLTNKAFYSLDALTTYMLHEGMLSTYQVAWVDILSTTIKAIHFGATHSENTILKAKNKRTLPKIPLRLLNKWTVKGFNALYFRTHKGGACKNTSFNAFNNPLDHMVNWNYLYGRKGLIQFQGLIPIEISEVALKQLIHIIKFHKATPTLAVLKLFTQAGEGLLSFCEKGFTIAIDLINDAQAQKAVLALNSLMYEVGGRVYLAKDVLLTPSYFQAMYPNHRAFSAVLREYSCYQQSDLAKRLGIL